MTKDQLTLAISKAQKAFYDRYFTMPSRVMIPLALDRVLFSGLQTRKINGVAIHPMGQIAEGEMVLQVDSLTHGQHTVIMAFADFLPSA